jgi:hypothetical protein
MPAIREHRKPIATFESWQPKAEGFNAVQECDATAAY